MKGDTGWVRPKPSVKDETPPLNVTSAPLSVTCVTLEKEAVVSWGFGVRVRGDEASSAVATCRDPPTPPPFLHRSHHARNSTANEQSYTYVSPRRNEDSAMYRAITTLAGSHSHPCSAGCSRVKAESKGALCG